MRKLFNELLSTKKEEKVCEKALITRLAMTVIIVVACLAAMSFTAYAYFASNITSSYNFIKTASFETSVSIHITDENGEAVQVITSNNKSHTAQLKANTKYLVTLQHTKRSTAKTGFVIVTATDCTTQYHTQQLGKDGNGNTETISFWLAPNANTTVTFLSHWGTSSMYPEFMSVGRNSQRYILDGETVNLYIIGAEENNDLPEESQEDSDKEESTPEDPADVTETDVNAEAEE